MLIHLVFESDAYDTIRTTSFVVTLVGGVAGNDIKVFFSRPDPQSCAGQFSCYLLFVSSVSSIQLLLHPFLLYFVTCTCSAFGIVVPLSQLSSLNLTK